MPKHTQAHYEGFSDKEIYEALCQVDKKLEEALMLQRNMLLAGWSEDAVFEKLKENADTEFTEQMDGVPGYLLRRALHHLAHTLWAQRPSAHLN